MENTNRLPVTKKMPPIHDTDIAHLRSLLQGTILNEGATIQTLHVDDIDIQYRCMSYSYRIGLKLWYRPDLTSLTFVAGDSSHIDAIQCSMSQLLLRDKVPQQVSALAGWLPALSALPRFVRGSSIFQ